MKKIILLIAVLIGLSTVSDGQTFFLADFSDSQMPPVGWTIDNLASQWLIHDWGSSFSGGTIPDGYFETYGTPTPEFTRLISPVIDLTGLTKVNFEFWHGSLGALCTIGVSTRSNGGPWHQVWEYYMSSGISAEHVELEIENEDVGSSTFQICLSVQTGTMLCLYFVDDIWLYHIVNVDGDLSKITTPTYIAGESPVTGTLRSGGIEPITSAEISWQLDDGVITITEFTGLSINFNENYPFTCNNSINSPIGSSQNLKVWIETINGLPDNLQSNDSLNKTVVSVCHTVSHRPFFEMFTSSTCDPCAIVNTTFVPWTEQNADQLTLLKYQMNWPGAGDPYYTPEGGVRREYYNITGVPGLLLDGNMFGTLGIDTIQKKFDDALLESSLIKIASTHSLTGTVMNIETTLLPFADLVDIVVQIAVFENITTGNVGTNGETEFHHVMMKMVPNANGTFTNLTDRVPFTINATVNLADTFIEEWDDLGVAVFVQESGSKYVWQSDYSIENGNFGTDSTLSQIYVNGEPLTGFSPEITEYNVELPMGTTEMPVVTAETNDPEALAIVIPTYILPGSVVVDVFAENLSSHQAYTLNFEISTTVGHVYGISRLEIFPNPTSGIIHILYPKEGKVMLFGIHGSFIAAFDLLNTGIIDLSDMETGVYFLKIETEDGSTEVKKIMIMK